MSNTKLYKVQSVIDGTCRTVDRMTFHHGMRGPVAQGIMVLLIDNGHWYRIIDVMERLPAPTSTVNSTYGGW